MVKTLKELGNEYDLELARAISEIKKIKTKNPRVLLQFPDGLKPYATAVVDFLEEKTSASTEFLIWFGDCFGACDTPTGIPRETPRRTPKENPKETPIETSSEPRTYPTQRHFLHI